MPEFCLRMVFPWVLYADSNIPQKLNRIIFRKKGSFEDKITIYKRNMVTRFHKQKNNRNRIFCDHFNSKIVNGGGE